MRKPHGAARDVLPLNLFAYNFVTSGREKVKEGAGLLVVFKLKVQFVGALDVLLCLLFECDLSLKKRKQGFSLNRILRIEQNTKEPHWM